MNTRRPIDRSALPEITDARVARQWAGTKERIAKRARARWQWPAVAVTTCALAVFVFVFVRVRPSPPITVGAVVESVGAQTVTLADGSRVDLAPSSRLRVSVLEAQRVELALERGAGVFDVRHAARRFVVRVGAFDVIDEGTRFDIALTESGEASVAVERGKVRVERRDSPEPARFLSAGDRWSARVLEPAPSSSAPASAPLSPAIASPSNALPPASAAPTPSAPAPDARPAIASPKDLLEAAQRAQREGRLSDAAAAYDRLRRDFRADPRAGLASFELGRLRLGPLGDPRGAIRAFEDASALAPKAPFREDAEAHLVEAFDAIGDVKRCEAARDTYLAAHPSGLHAASVAARCAPSR